MSSYGTDAQVNATYPTRYPRVLVIYRGDSVVLVLGGEFSKQWIARK